MHKALETEQHLEKALASLDKYKAYVRSKDLKNDYKTYKKHTFSKISASEEDNHCTQEEQIKVAASRDQGFIEQPVGMGVDPSNKPDLSLEEPVSNGVHCLDKPASIDEGCFDKPASID